MAQQEFNLAPYFDDFDPSKNFYRVLFKPSVPIQTRELNQLQSILAYQTAAIGSHLFKFGSLVKAGRPKYTQYANYVRLKDIGVDGNDVDIYRFVGKKVISETSGMTAEVIHVEPATEFDPPTLYVMYLDTAVDGTTSAFLNGEIINALDESGYPTYQVTVRCPDCAVDADIDTTPTNPTGKGSLFSNVDTSYYIYGNIVDVDNKTISLSKYTPSPSYIIGYQIVQSIVGAGDDQSLFDNSIGSPNYTAPGADRYKIKLQLIKKPISDLDNENFVFVAKVESGFLTKIQDVPQYADLMDTLARRTYDESGNYTVEAFKLQFKNDLKSDLSDNTGVRLAIDGGSETNYATMISPGKAYVRGRELKSIAESFVVAEKARNTEVKFSNAIRPTIGNYITVTIDPNYGTLPNTNIDITGDIANDFSNIMFFDGSTSGGSTSGTQIGTAKVKAFEIQSGTVALPETDPDVAIYKMHIFDISMAGINTMNDVRGFIKTDGVGTFYGNLVEDPIETGMYKIYNPIENKLFYPLPNEFITSIRDGDNPLAYSTQITIKQKLVGSVAANGTVTFASGANEVFKTYNPLTWICGKKITAEINYKPYDLTGKITSTPSLITIDAAGFTGHNMVLTCEVLKTSAKEKVKTYQSNGVVNSIDGVTEFISLGNPDVFKIKTIYDITGGLPGVDVTEHYTLNKNIKDNYYGISEIQRKSTFAEPVGGTIYDITFDYLEHSGDGFFFSVDSYTNIINDPNIDFTYEDLGTYTSNSGMEYRVSDIIDFRQTTDINNGFDTSMGAIVSNIPVNNSDIILDVAYFLPRIDSLVLLDTGEFIQLKGVPALKPYAPKTPDNAMKVYEIIMDAYTFDIKKDIKKEYVDNRRYTMQDIGKLETRIENLEYYVTFNILESSTEQLRILDEFGNERFKNGFMTDSFKDYIGSSTASGEYRSALDTEIGELRPSFNLNGVKMVMNDGLSSNFNKLDEVITLPYTDVLLIDQPYSSKTVSVNPYFIYNMVGDMRLSPETDVWNDVITQPDLVISVNTGFEALRNIANGAGIMGTTWNSWRNPNALTNTWDTQTTQVRTGLNRTIAGRISRTNLGSSVTSVNLIPYMRSTSVQFSASGLLPRTQVFPFFDGVDVSENCRMLSGVSGEPMITGDDGTIVGVFIIPPQTFFVGSRALRLTNTDNNSIDPDELTTSAEAVFYSAGLQSTVRNTSLSVSTPVVVGLRRTGDPIAQSFKIENQEYGCFISRINVYFDAKHDSIPAWCELRTMVNGYPSDVVLAYAKVTIGVDAIVSSDATIATPITFKAPVYVENDTEYCIVLGSENEAWRAHVSKLGGVDVTTSTEFKQSIISDQPSLGSFFKSQNGSTWTAEQLEDLKFQIYKAKFDTGSDMSLVFENDSYDMLVTLPTDPFETETATSLVRVSHKNHGFVPLDKVKLELHSDTWHDVTLSSGRLVVGQTINGNINAGTAIITDIQKTSSTIYKIKLSGLVGIFDISEPFVAPSFTELPVYENLLESQSIDYAVPINVTGTGSFDNGINTTIHGIPLTDITTPSHIIQSVDTFDSYIIDVATPATATGTVGGEGHKAIGNIQVDTTNFNMTYLLFGGTEVWTQETMSHSGIGGNGTNYNPNVSEAIVPNTNFDLENTAKIASELNEFSFYGNNKSLKITGTLSSISEDITPVINLDTLNYIAISNRIDNNDAINANVAPNATDRWIEETDTALGSVIAKYVTNPVNIETSASRLKIYVNALNFLHTTIDVYYRTLDVEVDDIIDNQAWVLARSITEAFSETDTDFREVEIDAPTDEIDVLNDFKSFQLKIVLNATKSAKPPKLQKLRVVAVT